MQIPEIVALYPRAPTDKGIDKKSLSTHEVLAVH